MTCHCNVHVTIIWAHNRESSGKKREPNRPPRQHVNANEQERLRFTPPAQRIAPVPSIHFDFCWKTSGRDCQVNAETLVTALCNWLRRVFGRERERNGEKQRERERRILRRTAEGEKVSTAFRMKAALWGLDEERWIRYACQWEK